MPQAERQDGRGAWSNLRAAVGRSPRQRWLGCLEVEPDAAKDVAILFAPLGVAGHADLRSKAAIVPVAVPVQHRRRQLYTVETFQGVASPLPLSGCRRLAEPEQ